MKKFKNIFIVLVTVVITLAAVISISSVLGAGDNWPSFVTGQDTLSSKGTPEQLSAIDIPQDSSFVLKAMTGNTGIIYVGYSSATALNSNANHFKLYPGESVELNIDDADLIWYDAESGEGIEWIVERAY